MDVPSLSLWGLVIFIVLTSCVDLYGARVGEDTYSHGDNTVWVSTIVLEPYVVIKDPLGVDGGPTYQGYIVDLLERLSALKGFKIHFQFVRDGEFGHRFNNGTWSGMIGELTRKEVDIAAAPMFITEPRAKVVDFSRPFMEVYATLLIQKPPSGQPTRIKTVEDLISQSEVQYGTLNTGIFLKAFKRTEDNVIKTMWRNMERFDPQVLTESNQEGIDRVRSDRYAFIIPNTIGDYISMQSPCDLMTTGKFLKQTGYGLAVQKGSPLKKTLDEGLLILDADGTLDNLYHKWWIEKSECNAIHASKIYSPSEAHRTNQIDLVLLVGCVVLLCLLRHVPL